MKRLRSVVFVAALVALPTGVMAQEDAVGRLLLVGQAQLDSGDYADARESFREVLTKDPDNGRAHLLLGRSQTFLKNYRAAFTAFEKARGAGVKVSADVGAAQYHAGKNAEALRTLATAVEEEPENADAHYFLGMARLKADKFAEARPAFAEARRLDPDLEAEALFFGGIAAIRAGQVEDGKRDLALAAALDPDSEAGRAAKETLGDLKAGGKAFELAVGFSNQYDTNVLLVPNNGALFTPQEISNKAGNRAVFTLRGAWLPKLTENWRGEAAYGLYQSAHWTKRDVLKALDLTNHALTLGAERQGEDAYLRLPYTLSVATLSTFDAGARYSLTNAISPTYVKRFASHAVGATDSLGYENYAVDPAAVTLDGREISQSRDNFFNRLDLFYAYSFAQGRGSVSPVASVLLANATGDSSWDHLGLRLGLSGNVPLGKHWLIGMGLSTTGRSYGNPFPIVGAGGATTAEDRSDSELGANLALGYGRGAWSFTGGWSFTRNNSSIDVFEYRRSIFTLGLGAQF